MSESSSASEQRAVVIDNGTGIVKSGFAGEDAPCAVFRSVIGTPKYTQAMVGIDSKTTYVGDEATAKAAMLKLTYPLDHGIVTNWEHMEQIWHHTFYNELRVDPSEHNVLLTEAPGNPKKNREHMAECMFETFNTPAMFVSVQAVLSLYASGRTTGLVLDVGDGVSHTVPVYEGYAIPHAVKRLNLAGHDITKRMQKLLREHAGMSVGTSSGLNLARSVKEKLSYIALDFDAEVAKASKDVSTVSVPYTLPDGTVIDVGVERFMAPEALFQPDMVGVEHEGLGHLMTSTVQACDIDLRRPMLENIVLSGGTTMTQGFSERLQKDIEGRLENAKGHTKIVAMPERKYAVWIGGSVLSSLSTFETMWVTKEMYDESGATVVHVKCD